MTRRLSKMQRRSVENPFKIHAHPEYEEEISLSRFRSSFQKEIYREIYAACNDIQLYVRFFKTFPTCILVIQLKHASCEMNLLGLMVSFLEARKSYGPANTFQIILLTERSTVRRDHIFFLKNFSVDLRNVYRIRLKNLCICAHSISYYSDSV